MNVDEYSFITTLNILTLHFVCDLMNILTCSDSSNYLLISRKGFFWINTSIPYIFSELLRTYNIPWDRQQWTYSVETVGSTQPHTYTFVFTSIYSDCLLSHHAFWFVSWVFLVGLFFYMEGMKVDLMQTAHFNVKNLRPSRVRNLLSFLCLPN